MPADSVERYGLTRDEAAEAVGMSKRAWDRSWKAGRAPEPSYPFTRDRNPRWSKDELRAWVAWGYPATSAWGPIWKELRARAFDAFVECPVLAGLGQKPGGDPHGA